MNFRMRRLPVFILLSLLVCAAFFCTTAPVTAAQDEPAKASAAAEPAETDVNGRSRTALSALVVSIKEVDRDLKLEREKLKTKLPADELKKTEADIKLLGEKRDALLKNLEFVVTGIDPLTFSKPVGETLDLQSETKELLLPIIQELKQLTASPREVESLRRQVASLQQDGAMVAEAASRIEEQIKLDADPALKPLLGELLESWRKRQNATDTELAVAEFKLEELEVKRGGVLGVLREVTSSFFRQRGRNLMLALCSAALIFGALRLLWTRLQQLPALKRKNRPFSLRLAVVAYHTVTFLLSAFAVLLVFYLAGDWVLLGLAVMFLIGIAWTGKQTLPAFYEQLKLLLNLGSVREGERVIYNGLPWEARSVGVFTELRNPVLDGGHVRLPLRDLMPLVSRPHEDEVWFPCEVDDWVCLSDGTHGKVVTQSPEWVQLVLLGGSRRTYPTQSFLELCPENLSKNYRVRSIFGVDYRHQAICTTEIPSKLKERLERELRTMVGADNMKNVNVELSEAGSSSLNYTILADFGGAVAQRHAFLIRAIQRICVDACNEHGWTIPFSQITLHQGEPVSS